MKFSRQWLNDYVDLSDLSDDQLGVRLTEIGHAVEATEQHGDDTVFDLEITTNRVDAMSHIGMARELAAALGRSTKETSDAAFADATASAPPTIRIEAPEMCARYTALVIRNIARRKTFGGSRPSPHQQHRRRHQLRDGRAGSSAACIRSRSRQRSDHHRPPRQAW